MGRRTAHFRLPPRRREPVAAGCGVCAMPRGVDGKPRTARLLPCAGADPGTPGTVFMPVSMPLGARVVALTALLWNLFGLLIFVMRLAAPEQAAGSGAALPGWLDAVFGLSVIAGTAGSVGLLLARRWAPALLLVSFVAVAVQLVAGYVFAPLWASTGAAGAAVSGLLLLMVGAIWSFSRAAARRGWLR